MNENQIDIQPYSLDVGLSPKSDSQFQWTIRRHGKVYQRSDRRVSSEAKARSDGMATIERLLTDHSR